MRTKSFIQDVICKNPIKMSFSRLGKKDYWKNLHQNQLIHHSERSTIERFQLDKLKKLLYVAQKAPYYNVFIKNLKKPIENITITDLKKFPILTKEIIRSEGRNMLTNNQKKLIPITTSGSTGTPLLFYQDTDYQKHVWSTNMIINEMCGWYYGARLARIWGCMPKTSKLLLNCKDYIQNTRFYNIAELSEKKIEAYHLDMSKFKPEIISSYTSSIYLIAKYLEARKIKPNYPKIAISTSCETLYPHMRRTIEGVFGVKIFDRYGSREVNGIASECEAHSGLHIFVENVVVECLDPITGEEVIDKPGEIIVTDLNNYGMPFIRYRVGDVGIATKQICSCGRNSLMFKQIMGRDTDFLTLKNGSVYDVDHFTHKFFDIQGVKEFQFCQDTIETFTISIVTDNSNNQQIIDKVKKEISDVLGHGSSLDVKVVDSIPKPANGKYRYFISKVSPDKIWQQVSCEQRN
ncbi:MAG: hypothetical protein DKM50_08375 [Candidatus Margulisiibacteriota bacterium]|nr:MAG: hypothetical protein A2X43_03155 [Candidatus Margulisbacteria bacterium GWD2_39_127]OGI05011.1 MAG: hypothetical protein A2X42_05420 [Candidatus Margulisbacteria bacterium GWF2_38_17]OGI09007.1 MAG: hypothetical protein A2X41_01615 [Candidatus Margulisbacteria bacterium GWE2_39_32]PZM79611.1 MAG: hypothetical protein DKM50_08375 [Candidatus Margulisiibacteriota bacterium]HAR63207.1 hypothetical protein [Candidatus Margulisiibacteriota bacterium]